MPSKTFEEWWLSEGINHMPRGDRPPEHATIAKLAWDAAALECKALRELLNRPEINNFLEGVKIEAAHQLPRWTVEKDRAKDPEEWYWLVGFLAGKALHAQRSGDDGKFMHHLISTAAVLSNWHYFASNPEPQEWETALEPTQ